MKFGRRELLLKAAALLPLVSGYVQLKANEEKKMYGLIGKLTAVAGQRDALIAILLEGVRDMPGCLSYVVAKDSAGADTIWITEVWNSEDSHKASLTLPSVKDAIGRGKPLIAGFGERVVTEPVGGHGLELPKRR
jgi:quinol monooxygenase YgiN